LEMGDDPQRIGIDLCKLLKFASTWQPTTARYISYSLPQDDAADLVGARVVDSIHRTSIAHVGKTITNSRTGRMSLLNVIETMWRFRNLQRRFRHFPEPRRMGVREAFFDWLDDDLRSSLVTIYKSYFPVEPRHEHQLTFERSRTLTARAVSLLE